MLKAPHHIYDKVSKVIVVFAKIFLTNDIPFAGT